MVSGSTSSPVSGSYSLGAVVVPVAVAVEVVVGVACDERGGTGGLIPLGLLLDGKDVVT